MGSNLWNSTSKTHYSKELISFLLCLLLPPQLCLLPLNEPPGCWTNFPLWALCWPHPRSHPIQKSSTHPEGLKYELPLLPLPSYHLCLLHHGLWSCLANSRHPYAVLGFTHLGSFLHMTCRSLHFAPAPANTLSRLQTPRSHPIHSESHMGVSMDFGLWASFLYPIPSKF